MTTYEIISYTYANEAERELLKQVADAAKTLASAQMTTRGNATDWVGVAEAATALNRDGVRAAFLNTQMELCGLHADMERHKVSQYATIREEIEGYIFGYALALSESETVQTS